ncbi:MAG: MerR family transcriptional regulator [Deltaproteobacteria bacterium]|nr:MAG: MerR family transcriptional regulator [Deltaproteobacteria bacterium]
MPHLLTEAQLRKVEAEHPDGLSSAELVAVFAEHEIPFSEATLRKYVQLGLVPRSRRVGRKGKHRGSRGIYPVRAVRRINTIKRLMAEQYTIEEIKERFFAFKDHIETVDEALGQLLSRFEERIAEEPSPEVRRRLERELESVRGHARELLASATRLEKLLLSAGRRPRPRGGGAASPTELL